MKAVLQVTEKANLSCDGKLVSDCKKGMLVLLGISKDDTEKEADILADKLMKLRIFPDENGKLNLSSKDVSADVLIVSNFTLMANCASSRRPDFLKAMKYNEAEKLYEYFLSKCEEIAKSEGGNAKIFRGVFGGDMKISLVNDGPLTVILDTGEF